MTILLLMQPFNLANQTDFENWAVGKLSLYSDERLKSLLRPITISADGNLSTAELKQVQQRVFQYNFAFYRIVDDRNFDIQSLNRLGKSLELEKLDANLCAQEDLISVITDSTAHQDTDSRKQRYIPYSNKALGWHTDGYYNPYQQRVRAFILHCQKPADSGGENSFIDPEMIYLLLRRQNPEFIQALCRDDVMRIPENRQDDVCLRSETASSVFQISDDFRKLDMRFSQRKRHIIWRDDTITQSALAALNELLNCHSNWHFDIRLNAGEGIISNNGLHRRKAYQDSSETRRAYLRARFYNAIAQPLN